MKWPEVQQFHAAAAAQLASTAERVRPEQWLVPRAAGKWSPAEVVEHLNLAYDVLTRELAGGDGMQVRTKLWQRLILRVTVMRKLLRGGAFPEGAPAPRELRPASPSPDQRAAIAAFRDRASRFESAAAGKLAGKRRIRVTHAYFGGLSVVDAVVLCASHVRHHERQLPQ